ncbi:VacJ family lipoprotein [uncultured Xylophilus sp.]|uniref:MlaA family lipoprotein n=1 Tax=uncultured Xylophilus sp. TaxID=296832 RepID=UPI0025F3847D|nr:VacJ family lipoprotein [uncultured Xylophilus sp.]
MTTTFLRISTSAGLIATAALLGGCATGPDRNPRDPFEPFNRGVFEFNEAVDRAVLRPVATVYRDATPYPVRAGVGNFFRNLTEPWSFVNHVLQLKPQAAGETAIRFGVNTFLGFGGLIDIAGAARIPYRRQDFGQTLAHYGVPTGPYVVLPILGPSTVRDTAALPVDFKGNLLSEIDDNSVRNSLFALRVVDIRASLLGATSVIEQAALDKYSFTRDSYLQLRRNQPRNAGDSDGDLNDSDEGNQNPIGVPPIGRFR